MRNHPGTSTVREVLRPVEGLRMAWPVGGTHPQLLSDLTAPATIDLAPGYKMGLTLARPLMPAAGCFGWGDAYSGLVDARLWGAVVVGPLTARPRQGGHPPRVIPLPAGVLLHTGLANPGVNNVLRRYGRVWARMPVPVIVHVAGTTPQEVATCCRRLATVEPVAGIELGVPGGLLPDDVAGLVEAARQETLLPLLVRLPLNEADVWCDLAVECGAQALTVAAPPRGEVWQDGHFVSGRLYGRGVFPQALRALRLVAGRVDVPLIGCGGVHTVAEARALLEAGAVAVQVGSLLWRDPAAVARLAREV